jgi:hypothetical protein
VSSQNSWYWSAENESFIYKLLVYDEKVGVWSVINAHRIIGSILYVSTVNAVRYVNDILHSFFAELTDEERLTVF